MRVCLVRSKKCRACSIKFTPSFSTTQVVCSPKCALEYEKIKKQKEQKKNDKIRREKLKTASDYVNEAQTAFNRYVRTRDRDKLCASCDIPLASGVLGGGFDAGHYRSRGAASHLKFNLLNVWGQCKQCNRHKGGNYSEYRKILVDRIGLDRVERLEHDNTPRKFSIEYLKRIKTIFNKRARYYEKRRKNN